MNTRQPLVEELSDVVMKLRALQILKKHDGQHGGRRSSNFSPSVRTEYFSNDTSRNFQGNIFPQFYICNNGWLQN